MDRKEEEQSPANSRSRSSQSDQSARAKAIADECTDALGQLLLGDRVLTLLVLSGDNQEMSEMIESTMYQKRRLTTQDQFGGRAWHYSHDMALMDRRDR